MWKTNENEGQLPAFKVDVVDTTGAGDAFHGTFAICLVNESAWNYTLKYSSAVAALCCTKTGARNGIPFKKEVDSFIQKNL